MALQQFELIGKKRRFNNVKMLTLLDFSDNMRDILNEKGKKPSEKYLEIGKLLSKLIKPFDPEEMLEIEADEMNLVQSLNMIYTVAKTKKSETEMQEYMEKIKIAAVDGQLGMMSNPEDFR